MYRTLPIPYCGTDCTVCQCHEPPGPDTLTLTHCTHSCHNCVFNSSRTRRHQSPHKRRVGCQESVHIPNRSECANLHATTRQPAAKAHVPPCALRENSLASRRRETQRLSPAATSLAAAETQCQGARLQCPAACSCVPRARLLTMTA